MIGVVLQLLDAWRHPARLAVLVLDDTGSSPSILRRLELRYHSQDLPRLPKALPAFGQSRTYLDIPGRDTPCEYFLLHNWSDPADIAPLLSRYNVLLVCTSHPETVKLVREALTIEPSPNLPITFVSPQGAGVLLPSISEAFGEPSLKTFEAAKYNIFDVEQSDSEPFVFSCGQVSLVPESLLLSNPDLILGDEGKRTDPMKNVDI